MVGALEDLAELFDVPQSRVELLKATGMDNFKVIGKVSGKILNPLDKRYAVKPAGRTFTVIVRENVLEELPESTRELFEKALKLPGKVVVDTVKGKIYSTDGKMFIVVDSNGFTALAGADSVSELIKVINSLSLGSGASTTISLLEELSKGLPVVRSFVPAVKVFIENDNIYVVFPKGFSIKISPDDSVEWKSLTAKVLAVMVKKGVIDEKDLEKVKDNDVRKMTKGILRTGIIDKITNII